MEPGFRQPFKKRRSLLRHTSCGEAEPCHFAFGDDAERLLASIRSLTGHHCKSSAAIIKRAKNSLSGVCGLTTICFSVSNTGRPFFGFETAPFIKDAQDAVIGSAYDHDLSAPQRCADRFVFSQPRRSMSAFRLPQTPRKRRSGQHAVRPKRLTCSGAAAKALSGRSEQPVRQLIPSSGRRNAPWTLRPRPWSQL